MKNIRGYQNGLKRFIENDSAQALTEYAILTLFVTLICLYLIDPNNEIFKNIRQFYDTVAIMLYLPGP